jgi:glycosyltransferase involved in cell wall biosynthesis
VLWRLQRRFRKSRTDAVITVGAGDKMFWGRLAARLAGVPVICSALHSTGWPDGVGRLNRTLTPLTDAFIAVAQDHAQFLINWEGFPRDRVFMIPNGVDTDRFCPNPAARSAFRQSLQVPDDAPLVGIVAALREEKNHHQFLSAARDVLRLHPDTRFVIVGDGPMRSAIEQEINDLGLKRFVYLLGTRSDTPDILAALDVFALTSKNEANPVSILEALACGIPVVSPNVGSIHETVLDGQTGFLTKPGSSEETADAIVRLLGNKTLATSLGRNGREHMRHSWSLSAMVTGYERLITMLYNDKVPLKARLAGEPSDERIPVAPLTPLLVLPNLESTAAAGALASAGPNPLRRPT